MGNRERQGGNDMEPLDATDPANVGGYQILGVLGGGGMGRVYLGRSRSGRRLAIKVVRGDLADDPAFRRRFAREVAAAHSVSPLFTAAVVDADPHAERPWLATTFIEGPSLYQWVRENGPLASGAVLTLASVLAEALSSIHRAGLVHHDLKPSNVLLADDGPRIVDFGLAQMLYTGTRTTGLLGTPSYMAPERLRGEDAGPPSDVFSLGATLAFAATGRALVPEGTMFAQLAQISRGRFDLSSVPRPLIPLITRCLSQRPHHRPTADELVSILVGTGVRPPGPGWYTDPAKVPPVRLRPPGSTLTRRRVLLIGAAATAGVAATGGIVTWATSRRAPSPAAAATPAAVASTPAHHRPGELRWLASSGLATTRNRSDDPTISPIVVGPGPLIITAQGPAVRAVSPTGQQRWQVELSRSPVLLRRWAEGTVLATDRRVAWLLDAGTGQRRFARNVTGPEVTAQSGATATHASIGIRRAAFSASHAFLDLGTATVAIDRTGHRTWRIPRAATAAPGSGRPEQAHAYAPNAASSAWLLAQDSTADAVRVSLYRADTAEHCWSTGYTAAAISPPAQGGAHQPPPGAAEDPAWLFTEARLGASHAAVRAGSHICVLRLDDGEMAWEHRSTTPVVGIELVGEVLLICAGQISAYALDTGELVWQTPLRGARVVVRPDGLGVLAGSPAGAASVDLDGRLMWHTALPGPVRDAAPDRITADADTAYLTFASPLGRAHSADVMAVAWNSRA